MSVPIVKNADLQNCNFEKILKELNELKLDFQKLKGEISEALRIQQVALGALEITGQKSEEKISRQALRQADWIKIRERNEVIKQKLKEMAERPILLNKKFEGTRRR